MVKKVFWFLRLVFLKPFFKSVGKNSYLGPTVATHGLKGVSIGNRVRIYPGARMETHNGGEIIIGDNCAIAQNFHVTSTNGTLDIGANTTILGNVFITNIDHEYQEIGKPILEQPYKYSETQIGENCFIGFGASIQAGTVLGKQCIVGTNAVVRGTYPDYSVIVGVPAKAIKRYNEETGDWEKI
ncbi:TPA: acyltransferase [Streptococcus suis]|nr:acyltransferase [Streptococcus suis]HEP1575812.1 acyltransferase [Streptococcus suis]